MFETILRSFYTLSMHLIVNSGRGIAIWLVCECEREQVNMSKQARLIFWGNISLTHGIEYCMTWRNILPHVQGWTIKMNDKWKRVNKTYPQPRGMCQPKHHVFISKRYVSIRNWNNMQSHILYTISIYFLFEFNLSNLLCLRAFLLLER